MAIVGPECVAVVGELFIDEIFTEFGQLPKLGEEAFARQFKKEIGGGAAITACALAKLGVPVRVLGIVGTIDGRWVVDRLLQFGVDCSALKFAANEPTGITVSASTREDRSFLTYYGANALLGDYLNSPDTIAALAACEYVHLACAPDELGNADLFDTLHRNDVKISIDVQAHASWLTRPESVKVLRRCNMFFPNEKEGCWVSSAVEPYDILSRLNDKGLDGVGLKLGSKGAALLWRGTQYLEDAYPVENKDSTGAGDCFNAGFLYAQIQGYPPERCLRLANICGALSTRALGGIDASPTLRELTECESRLDKTQ